MVDKYCFFYLYVIVWVILKKVFLLLYCLVRFIIVDNRCNDLKFEWNIKIVKFGYMLRIYNKMIIISKYRYMYIRLFF